MAHTGKQSNCANCRVSGTHTVVPKTCLLGPDASWGSWDWLLELMEKGMMMGGGRTGVGWLLGNSCRQGPGKLVRVKAHFSLLPGNEMPTVWWGSIVGLLWHFRQLWAALRGLWAEATAWNLVCRNDSLWSAKQGPGLQAAWRSGDWCSETSDEWCWGEKPLLSFSFPL